MSTDASILVQVSDSSSKTQKSASLELAKRCASFADEKKGEDIVVLDVRKLASYADFLVVASGLSERQVQAMGRYILSEQKASGRLPIGVEGLEHGHWVLIDFGDVLIHLFLDSVRPYYDLESMWSDAPRVKLAGQVASSQTALHL